MLRSQTLAAFAEHDNFEIRWRAALCVNERICPTSMRCQAQAHSYKYKDYALVYFVLAKPVTFTVTANSSGIKVTTICPSLSRTKLK